MVIVGRLRRLLYAREISENGVTPQVYVCVYVLEETIVKTLSIFYVEFFDYMHFFVQ